VKDQIVRSAEGRPLFRICYRHNDLHVIMRRDVAPPRVMESLVRLMKQVLVDARVNDERRHVNDSTPVCVESRQPRPPHREDFSMAAQESTKIPS